MRRSPRAWLLCVALVWGCGPGYDDDTVRARSAALMDELHARGLFNGAVVLGRDGVVLYEGAWGEANREAGLRFTTHTPVDGASLAKTFTAGALWVLADEGRLDLDAPVTRYVAEFPHAETTVRQLLSHSAGLGEWDDPAGLSNLQLVERLRTRSSRPEFAPGTRMRYCNACYDVLAAVIERVSGQRYDEFLRARFFEPLAMDSTFLRPARLTDWRGTRTLGYRRVNNATQVFDVEDDEAFYGSANLYLSARDLHAWATSFYARPILPERTFGPALDAARFANGERSAINYLSWYTHPDSARYVYSGDWRGFHHEVYWDPTRRISIVWVTNDLHAKPLPAELTRALIDIMEGREFAEITAPATDGTSAELDAEAAGGTFTLPSVGRVRVDASGPLPMVVAGNRRAHECFVLDRRTCFIPDLDVTLRFSDLRDGRFRSLRWLSTFESLVGDREP
ncbi:MAG: beta-lactamase family protein [Gemmatimonadaceae bacterium]|nr:beta-lactamase family protein [Gemmatimonadaceae bacterium]